MGGIPGSARARPRPRRSEALDGGAGDDLLDAATNDGLTASNRPAGRDTLDGGAGFDVADYSNAFTAVTLDLATNAASGGAANDRLLDIEGLIGSAFGDSLGGGGGIDRVSYAGSSAGVQVQLDLGTRAGGSGGDAAGDRLFAIENVDGSALADILLGYGSDNRLDGGSGDDGLLGGGGADILLGGVGDDTLVGGAGSDRLDGGAGRGDTAVFLDATAGLLILLAPGEGATSAGDTLVSIENVRASAFADQIIGTLGANRLAGGDGADTILASGVGQLGLSQAGDELVGEAGDDHLIGGAGADRGGRRRERLALCRGRRRPARRRRRLRPAERQGRRRRLRLRYHRRYRSRRRHPRSHPRFRDRRRRPDPDLGDRRRPRRGRQPGILSGTTWPRNSPHCHFSQSGRHLASTIRRSSGSATSRSAAAGSEYRKRSDVKR